MNETKLNSCPEDNDLEAKLKQTKDAKDIVDYECVGARDDDIDVSQESYPNPTNPYPSLYGNLEKHKHHVELRGWWKQSKTAL